MSPPPSQEDVTSKAGASGAAPSGDAPGYGFSRDFASVEEFLAFARAEMAGLDAPLSLANSGPSAKEFDLVTREEAVRA